MLTNKDINIRDPYVLVHDGMYYLYGTRGATCWGEADGFDCYVGTDLEHWSEAAEVFHRPEGFWADRNYWAPEVHVYQGKFYMFASFKSEDRERCTIILKADNPLGPFEVHSEGTASPEAWGCLDGTLYTDHDGKPYLVFCHEWKQVQDGTICAVALSDDLNRRAGEPRTLFAASEARPWVRPVISDVPGENYVTDGPFMYRTKQGRLLMLWSSFGEEGYAQAAAYSDNGDISGNWKQDPVPLYTKDGGHGMIFDGLDGKKYLALHAPNSHLNERPIFHEIEERDDRLFLR